MVKPKISLFGAGLIGLLVCVLISAAIIYDTYVSIGGINMTLDQNELALGKMQAELLSIDEDKGDSLEDIKIRLNSAQASGKIVADAQTAYFRMDPIYQEEELKANAELIGKYMADKTKQVPWMTSGETPYKWVFNTTYSFSGDTVPVLWTCYSTDGNETLLGYAVGMYRVSDDMFYDVSYRLTTYGTQAGATDENDSSYTVTIEPDESITDNESSEVSSETDSHDESRSEYIDPVHEPNEEESDGSDSVYLDVMDEEE